MTAKTSINTPHKMDAFRKIMAWHITITDAARGVWYRNRWPFKKEYLYIDLYAGPGSYQCKHYTGNGSPLIATNSLEKALMPYKAILFNLNDSECATLQESLNGNSKTTIINANNQNATNYLQCFKKQFGLAYFDPNHVHFDFELGQSISQCLPKVDLLFFLSGSVEKRTRKNPKTPMGEGHSTLEKMSLLNKKMWFVYALHSKFQYTFLLGTNAEKIKDWQKIGWYKIDTPKGQSTLTRLNWTGHEIATGQALQRGFDFLDEEE